MDPKQTEKLKSVHAGLITRKQLGKAFIREDLARDETFRTSFKQRFNRRGGRAC